jgi:hypothetical protein
MAATIYVASTERHSGKTALCIGLIHWFREKGLAAGYMKPVSSTPRSMGGRAVDEDVMFIKATLGLPEPLEAMSPVLLTVDAVKAAVVSPDTGAYERQIVEAHRTVTDGKDVVVMEGGSNLREGRMINLSAGRISELLGARALVVVPYVDTLQIIDDLLAARLSIGEPMMGAVINSVFQQRMAYAGEKVKPFLEARGVPVFATLPRERLLLSVSVGELLEGLGGETLCCEDALDELVENLMVGAMSVESALTYFRRASGKAVITGGDRVDIQLAALETSTRCLILTGNIRPDPLIIGLATERHVPIILTGYDTLNAIQTIENFFGKTRFQQQKKVEYFEALLDKWMDFGALTKSLGLSV